VDASRRNDSQKEWGAAVKRKAERNGSLTERRIWRTAQTAVEDELSRWCFSEMRLSSQKQQKKGSFI
jgi:hypothetical protein